MINFIISLLTILIQVFAGVFSFLYYRYYKEIAWLFIAVAIFSMAVAGIINISLYSTISMVPLVMGTITSTFLVLAVLLGRRGLKEYKKTDTHLKTLWEIDRIMLTSLTPKTVINSLKSRIPEMIDCDALAIYALDKSSHSYTVFVNHNLNQDFHTHLLSKENDFFWKIIDRRKSGVLSKLTADTNFGFPAFLKNAGFTACAGVPLMLRGLPVGCLFVFSSKAKTYNRKELKFIEGIGRQIVIAMERTEIFERIKEQNVESVLALVQAIEIRDPCTKEHSQQVAHLAIELYKNMTSSDKDLELIEYAGLLHDVGKIAVPELILNKPAPLNQEEWLIMKRHPVQSAEIVKPIKALEKIVTWILYHHERLDGSGYPQGLKFDEIPLESKVLAICDAFSAMVGKRPYRDAFTIAQAIDEIERFAGKQFDPEVVKIFLKLPEEILRLKTPENLHKTLPPEGAEFKSDYLGTKGPSAPFNVRVQEISH
ncbi:MAG: HD domain-containing phosphohydrolase [bacterium]